MKTLFAALACFCLPILALADSPPPPYCVDFPADACTRMQAVIESNIRPDYCVPGFGMKGSGLDREQLRICYAMPTPLSPEERKRFEEDHAKIQAKRQQEISDARAMVSDEWGHYTSLIKAIEMAQMCDVVDAGPANVAIIKLQVEMQNVQNRAGLNSDPVMNSQTYMTDAVQAGKVAAAGDACVRLTPPFRGRIRSLVADLIR